MVTRAKTVGVSRLMKLFQQLDCSLCEIGNVFFAVDGVAAGVDLIHIQEVASLCFFQRRHADAAGEVCLVGGIENASC